jgi:hypothetical protein
VTGTWPLARAAIAAHLNGLVLGQLIDIPYDGESGGPFQLGELLTFSGGATGRLMVLTDAGTTGTLTVRMIGSVSNPANNETITGGTSAATAAVNGTVTGGIPAETLSAYEYAPGGRQGASEMPYAFITPAQLTVGRGPTSWREITADVRVRFVLAPMGSSDPEKLHQQYDGWCMALIDRFDSAAALNGYADISVEQSFEGFFEAADLDNAWCFDMTLLGVRVSEAATFTI